MLHEPEYHILYNMYLELSMSTALNYYAAEFNRLWSKIINLYTYTRYHSRFVDCLAHPNLNATLASDQKMTLKFSSYLLPKFSRVSFTIVLISGISTMVNGTLLNFGKRYEDDLRVIFDRWQKLHLGLDALSNQKILKGIYYI